MKRIRSYLRRTPLLYVWGWTKRFFVRPRSQNDEAEILDILVANYRIPRTFVEFGFGAWEFNCAGLVADFDGLLIDGDQRNVRYARIVLPRNIRCESQWLDIDHLDLIRQFAQEKPLGILSVDVDGNDYWLLRALIDLNPALIIVEYNASFGLRPVTVPYDPAFRRFEKHPDGWYYGASLAAMNYLCSQHGYSLVALSSNNVNAFFLRGDLRDPKQTSSDIYEDCAPLVRKLQAAPDSEVFSLPLVDVTQDAD